MKIFFDTNVLLDYIMGRENCDLVSKIMSTAYHSDYIRIYVSALTIANTAYLLRKGRTTSQVRSIIISISKLINVLSTSDMQIYLALRSNAPDFEDSIQIMCAEERNCDIILTSNIRHFKLYTDIPVMTPAEFASHFKSA